MAEIYAMNAQFVSTKKTAALNPVDEASTTDTAVAEAIEPSRQDAVNTILENIENVETVSAAMREKFRRRPGRHVA
jgi:hypothetical protein